jgi:hypothetical protein
MTDFPPAIRLFSEAQLAGRSKDRGRVHRRPMRVYPTPMPAPGRRRTVVRLWLPLTALFVLMAPFALLLSPLAYFAPPRVRGPNPILAAVQIGRLLMSLGGTEVDVDTPDAKVHIRIF